MTNTTHKNTDKDIQNHTRQTAEPRSHSNASKESATEKHGKQGFASMDTEKQRKIAAKGGRASHR